MDEDNALWLKSTVDTIFNTNWKETLEPKYVF